MSLDIKILIKYDFRKCAVDPTHPILNATSRGLAKCENTGEPLGKHDPRESQYSNTSWNAEIKSRPAPHRYAHPIPKGSHRVSSMCHEISTIQQNVDINPVIETLINKSAVKYKIQE